MTQIKYSIIFLILLTSCNSFSEAGKVLRNEKVNTTDEFLVEKKAPLILPPDYSEIPVPGTLSNKSRSINDEGELKKILKNSERSTSNSTSSSSIEDKIIDKIKK